MPPNAEPIYNSTILTYFIKYFTLNDATVPDELIDENVRTDLSWIKRLTLGEENAKEMLHQLVYEGTLSYNKSDLKSKAVLSKGILFYITFLLGIDYEMTIKCVYLTIRFALFS